MEEEDLGTPRKGVPGAYSGGTAQASHLTFLPAQGGPGPDALLRGDSFF